MFRVIKNKSSTPLNEIPKLRCLIWFTKVRLDSFGYENLSIEISHFNYNEASMSFLRDKVILLTGATGGLGKEMVKQFTY